MSESSLSEWVAKIIGRHGVIDQSLSQQVLKEEAHGGNISGADSLPILEQIQGPL